MIHIVRQKIKNEV